jgi:hypothetical protein
MRVRADSPAKRAEMTLLADFFYDYSREYLRTRSAARAAGRQFVNRGAEGQPHDSSSMPVPSAIARIFTELLSAGPLASRHIDHLL